MSKRWPTGRSHEEEQPASEAFSRLFVLAFVVAGGTGFVAGVIWLGWNLIR